MEIALIILACVYAVDVILSAFFRAGGTGEMLVTAFMFCLKGFGYLLLFGLCIQIIGWLAVLLHRSYKLFKRWRHSRRAMRESCCELEEEKEEDCERFGIGEVDLMARVMAAEKTVITRTFEKVTVSVICGTTNNHWSITVGLKWKEWTDQNIRYGQLSHWDLPWSREWRCRYLDAINPLCEWYVEQYRVVNKIVLSKEERNNLRLGMYFALADAMDHSFFYYKNFKKAVNCDKTSVSVG